MMDSAESRIHLNPQRSEDICWTDREYERMFRDCYQSGK